MPGQLGPISFELLALIAAFTLSISRIGIPSVIQTIKGIPLSTASMIEFAA